MSYYLIFQFVSSALDVTDFITATVIRDRKIRDETKLGNSELSP